MDAVATGFATVVVVRGDGVVHRGPDAQVLEQYRAAQSLTLGQ